MTQIHFVNHNHHSTRPHCKLKREAEPSRSATPTMGARDIEVDDLPKNAANYTALTPLYFLERAALIHPHRKSVVHGSLHYTWHQTYSRCRQLASALLSRSIGLGSTVRTLYRSFLLLHFVTVCNSISFIKQLEFVSWNFICLLM